MYCSCGNKAEMLTRQHELREYKECGACGRVHWTGKSLLTAGEKREAEMAHLEVLEGKRRLKEFFS